MQLRICRKICSECPFKKNSLQGWLGNHTTDSISEQINLELPFSCHMVREDNEEVNNIKLLNGEHVVCRGFIATATVSVKRFGAHPVYGEQMKKLQDEITVEDKEQVMNKWDFKKYHDKL